jgi:CheY-like chemotaxis protein
MSQSVLLIEDELDVREIVGHAIADAGYSAVGVGSGRTALEYLRSNPPPKLILLDWHLPESSGADVMLEVVKSPAFDGVPVVLMTADARAAQESLQLGFAGYLHKPFTFDALHAVLERFLPHATSG